MAETQVSIRIDLESGGRIGPGKIALLEAIRETGSITAAAQSMQMSYRRAWLLVDELNKLLSEPVVTTATGGAMGGGTTSYASRRKDHRALPLNRSAHSTCCAQRISGLSEIDARLSAGRGGMDASRRRSVFFWHVSPRHFPTCRAGASVQTP